MNLYTIEEKVEYVLREYEDSRSSDFILIYRVFKEINENAVIRKPFYEVMLNYHEYNFPAIASIMRSRRKVYQKYPDLKPEKVSKKRAEKIEEYKEYSRS
jgi:hypothetical protein